MEKPLWSKMIEQCFTKHGGSQEQFAETLGVSGVTLRRWLKGTHRPRISERVELANRLFGDSPEEREAFLEALKQPRSDGSGPRVTRGTRIARNRLSLGKYGVVGPELFESMVLHLDDDHDLLYHEETYYPYEKVPRTSLSLFLGEPQSPTQIAVSLQVDEQEVCTAILSSSTPTALKPFRLEGRDGELEVERLPDRPARAKRTLRLDGHIVFACE